MWNATSADGAQRPVQQRRPPLIDEHALDEVAAQTGVVQASLLLNRQRGETLRQRVGEEAASRAGGGASARGVDLHTEEAATRGVLREHVAVQPQTGQLVDATRRPRTHRIGVVRIGVHAPHAERAVDVNEAHRLARRPHPHLGLRADGRPRNVRRKRLYQEVVAEAPAVVAQRLAKQAGADADARLGERRAHTCMVLPRKPEGVMAGVCAQPCGQRRPKPAR